mmetsp:Transcript_30322/g.97908  ORF Transcript_30322/g.97908 Transcript_30322/m.97908 type:complete len:206 (-) Transcript_30322:590-1207(-)
MPGAGPVERISPSHTVTEPHGHGAEPTLSGARGSSRAASILRLPLMKSLPSEVCSTWMPDAATRSSSAWRGKASSSCRRGTYLSSITAVRTVSSPSVRRQASTSCDGGNDFAALNLCTYLSATPCSPAPTIWCRTSAGVAWPSTSRACMLHALSAPSYRFSTSMPCSSALMGNSLRRLNSRANRAAEAKSLLSTRRFNSSGRSNA